MVHVFPALVADRGEIKQVTASLGDIRAERSGEPDGAAVAKAVGAMRSSVPPDSVTEHTQGKLETSLAPGVSAPPGVLR